MVAHLVVGACALGFHAAPAQEPGAESRGPTLPPFSVRSPWAGGSTISWFADSQGGPLDDAEFTRAIARALEAWEEEIPFRFRPAAAASEADLRFAWGRGAHGTCPPFGVLADVAHAGPPEPGTFVHFDADREWLADGNLGLTLHGVALHEIGHVLGLGHTFDPDTLMFGDTDRSVFRITVAERYGMTSLYGGGEDAAADLLLMSSPPGGGASERVGLALRGVAPPGVSDFTLFDTDGDGSDEVCVWRTDRAGLGSLTIYFFAPGPRLIRTHGPWLGVVAPGSAVHFAVGPAGERILVFSYGEGNARARLLDARGGRPVAYPIEDVELAPVSPDTPSRGPCRKAVRGDLDADGFPELVVAAEST